MFDLIGLLFGGTLSGMGSLIGWVSNVLFYSTGIAGNLFAAGTLMIIILAITMFFRNFGVFVVGVPLVIIAYLFTKAVIPYLLVAWVIYMIIQTRRGKVL